MSYLSSSHEYLCQHDLWQEALAAHTVLLPDASDDFYWPIRRFLPQGNARGLLWIFPESKLHGAWYLLNAYAASTQGFVVYIPEKRGYGLHPAPHNTALITTDLELLLTYFDQWHSDLKPSRWHPQAKQVTENQSKTDLILKTLQQVDNCLPRKPAPLSIQIDRARAEAQSNMLTLSLPKP